MRVRLLLVRHGETDWNLEGRYQGRSDVPLNSTGRAQAEQLAGQLAAEPIDAVYSSTLLRSLETARAIARRHGLEVNADPRLNEINQGKWEGLLSTEIAVSYPDLFRRWGEDPRAVSPPEGETFRQVHDRVIAAVEEMADRHPGGTLCVVTHKAAMVVIRSHYCGLDFVKEMGKMPGNARWEPLEIAAVAPGPTSPCCSVLG